MAKARPLSRDERLNWLRLIRSENVGPITFHQLMRHFASAEAALEALPELAKRGGRKRPIKICPKAKAEDELAALEALGGQLIAACEPAYPRALRALEDAPPVLSLLGHAHVLERPMAAIVGARNASMNGKRLAREFAEGLGEAGFVVVSGLARGIDSAAHAGALKTGTVAVLAGGIDVVYPPENEPLYESIREEGAIIAELALGSEPLARNFPRRNRIVSGLALGVLVVEAAPKSGSLITARFALEQGREVFAVPGSPLDPRARGANDLIRQGALLTQSAQDMIAQLRDMSEPPVSEPEQPEFAFAPQEKPAETELEKARRALAALLGPTPVAVDELIRECQVSAAVIRTVLLEMELAGRLERHPGNRVSLLVLQDS